MKLKSFVTSCVECYAEQVIDCMDNAIEITNRTFRKHVGSENYKEFEESLGYGSHLRLHQDRTVKYFKGKFDGRPAVICQWSAIEHFFV